MLLSAGSGADDVLFGSPVSGRFGQIDGISQQVGLFSNTLPVRVRLDASRALPPQLAELQAQQIQLIEHDDVGLGKSSNWPAPARCSTPCWWWRTTRMAMS